MKISQVPFPWCTIRPGCWMRSKVDSLTWHYVLITFIRDNYQQKFIKSEHKVWKFWKPNFLTWICQFVNLSVTNTSEKYEGTQQESNSICHQSMCKVPSVFTQSSLKNILWSTTTACVTCGYRFATFIRDCYQEQSQFHKHHVFNYKSWINENWKAQLKILRSDIAQQKSTCIVPF